MLLVDDLAAGGTKNLRHTPRGLVTLKKKKSLYSCVDRIKKSRPSRSTFEISLGKTRDAIR